MRWLLTGKITSGYSVNTTQSDSVIGLFFRFTIITNVIFYSERLLEYMFLYSCFLEKVSVLKRIYCILNWSLYNHNNAMPMVKSCCVWGCTARFQKGSGLLFCSFPNAEKKAAQRKKWVENLKKVAKPEDDNTDTDNQTTAGRKELWCVALYRCASLENGIMCVFSILWQVCHRLLFMQGHWIQLLYLALPQAYILLWSCRLCWVRVMVLYGWVWVITYGLAGWVGFKLCSCGFGWVWFQY